MTSLEYRLHDLGPVVLGGPLIHPLGSAAGVLRFYRDFVADAPDALTTIVNLRRAPPLPVVPSDLHGRPIVSISVCYAGCSAHGPAAYERLAALKARYDPANFFRGNQNIPQRSGGQRA